MLTQLIHALQNLGNRNKKKLISSANYPLHIHHEENWPEPNEIEIGTFNAPELKKEMLPQLVSDYVFEQAKLRDNADPEYAAIAVLASAAALIGGAVTISPKRLYKDWNLKPILWAMIIGSPSRMKTPSLLIGINLFKYATKQVIEPTNQQLEKEFQASQRSIKAKISKLEKDAEKHIQEGNDKAAKKIYLEIEQLTLPLPKYRKPFINDATIEALIKRIESNPLGLLLYRDELYGWISGLESKEKAQERSFCNEAFNGYGVYEVERINRGNLIIENPTLFVLGNIQPDRLKILISGRC